jgi:hypothetical protein
MLGFLGKAQESILIDAPGRTSSSAGIRSFENLFGVWLNRMGGTFEYLPSNTGTVPDLQQTSAGQVAFNGDARSIVGIGSDLSNTYSFLIGRSANTVFLRYSTTAALVPANRQIRQKLYDPSLIRSFYAIGGGAGGGSYIGAMRLPYCPNMESFAFINGPDTNAYTTITAITGMWSKKLRTFRGYATATAMLTAIENPFPASLEYFIFGFNNATSAGLVNNLIAACVNLKGIYLAADVWAETVTSPTPFSGTLQISHVPAWKYLLLNSASVTDVNYALTDVNIKRLGLRGATALSGATFQALVNLLFASTTGEFINLNLANQVWTRTFVDGDFKSTLTDVWAYGNRFTGNLSLTTARPGIVNFAFGNDATSLAAAAKSDLQIVNISGLTSATLIDMSNCRIEQITLPANTVATTLALGGNELDTAVADFRTALSGMTGLTSLYLSNGGDTTVGSDAGQNSTNGIGVLNLSTLIKLVVLRANSCKITGTLTVPATLATLVAANNTITGLSGAGNALTTLRIPNSTAFVHNFATTPNVAVLVTNSNSLTAIDLSGKTTTAQYGRIEVTNCATLASFSFSAVAGRAAISPSSGTVIQVTGCPLLTVVNNLANISYSATTTGRPFNFSGNALNMVFPFGSNSFVPSAAQIQNNGISTANLDATIDNMYLNRAKFAAVTIAKSCNVAGTNSAATGVYQAPVGFSAGVSDGSPATAKEKMYVLAINYGITFTYN